MSKFVEKFGRVDRGAPAWRNPRIGPGIVEACGIRYALHERAILVGEDFTVAMHSLIAQGKAAMIG